MDKEYRMYKILYSITQAILRPFFRLKAFGRENLPEGPALVCANHSSWVDPFLLAYACTIKRHIIFMAKVELFRIPVIGRLIRSMGTFPVDRSTSDIGAIRSAMRNIKQGRKLGIFPEGTRSAADDLEPKVGAIKIAEKTGAPIVPMYIPRKKSFFKRSHIVIGAPYLINPEKAKLSQEDYMKLAEELLQKIVTLGTGAA